MKIAIFSDVHANLEALERFYEFAQKELNPDYYIFLGDVVGYGPNPSECLDFVRKISFISVLGNHDYAMINKEESSFFNDMARTTALWTMKNINENDITYLKSLPLVAVFDNRYFVHASPKSPSSWPYILSKEDADAVFREIMHNIIFIGHTHYPVYYVHYKGETTEFSSDERFVKIEDNKKYIFNVGSIGQPRDGDNRLSFVLHDTTENTVRYYRLEYDFEKTIEKIKKAGLPEMLAIRLRQGR